MRLKKIKPGKGRQMKRDVTEVTPGILKLQFEIPYNVQPVNMFLLKGTPLTLIDTGPIMDEVAETIPATLVGLGCPPSSIERIILTHHHPDHMGLAARFKGAGGAEVVCHRKGRELLGDYWHEFKRLQEYMIGESEYMGLDREMVAASFKASYQWNEVAEPVEIDRLVDDGDLLDSPDFPLEVIYTPGHCIDHICLFLKDEDLLFSGDMLLNTITPNPDIYPPWQSEARSGLPGYIESLKKVRELNAGRALPGHGDDIVNPAKRIDEVLQHHEERLKFVENLAEWQPLTVIQMTLEMLAAIEAEMNTENIFLGMREVFGHLEILESQGRVMREMRGEAAYYRKA